MNICLFVQSAGWGGAETVVHELARNMNTRNHKTTVVVNAEIEPFFRDLNDVRIISIGRWYPSGLVFDKPTDRSGVRGLAETVKHILPYVADVLARHIMITLARRRIRQSASEDQFDVVNSHGSSAIMATQRLFGSKTCKVSTMHGEHVLTGGIPTGGIRSLLSWTKRNRLRYSLERSDRITAVSRSEAESIHQLGVSRNRNVDVINNGIDLSRIRLRNAGILAPRSGDFKILFPGGSRVSKGGDMLPETVRRMVDKGIPAHLYIALDVPMDSAMRKSFSEFGLDKSVTFCGFLNKSDYESLLASVDLFLLPSRFEAFPVTLLEAMAFGKPIVCSGAGGIPEIIVNGRNGLVVDPTPESLSLAIESLYRNPSLREAMSQCNLKEVDRYDWSVIVGKYETTFSECVKLRLS